MKIRKSDNLRSTADQAKIYLSFKNGISLPNAIGKRRIDGKSAGKSPAGRQLRSSVDQSELLRAKSLENLRLTRALKQSEKNLRRMTVANHSQIEENSSLKVELDKVKSQLQQHQTQLKNALDTELECPICTGPMIEAVVSAVCGHSFCKSCIDRWMQEKRQCPTCRSICYRTAPAVAIRQLHEKLLDCLDADSRQKYAEAVEERRSEPPITRQPNPNPVGVGTNVQHYADLFPPTRDFVEWLQFIAVPQRN